MDEASRHHYVPAFLLRPFAVPPSDDGMLWVLDAARRKVFRSRPSRCAFRHGFNRVDSDTHPEPLVVEKFYSKVEGMVGTIIQQMRASGAVPASAVSREWLFAFVAMQLVRTPRFRRYVEGKYFETLESVVLRYGRNKASRRRFKQLQQKMGVPEESWSPEGVIARLKSGDFSVKTNKDWKIGLSNDLLLPTCAALRQRDWIIRTFEQTEPPLVIGDEAAAMFPLRPLGSVGVGRADTVVFLPIGPRQALVGYHPAAAWAVNAGLTPMFLNTVSFAWSLEHCFGTGNDFIIDDPDRGPTLWSTFCSEGCFPKLAEDAGDLADVYSRKAGLQPACHGRPPDE